MKASYVVLFLTILLISCQERGFKRVLPILGNRDVEYRMEDGKEVADTLYHLAPAFSYTNHLKGITKSSDLKDQILIVDFFFSNCPTICPPMTSQMKRLNLATQDLNENVTFLSFSIDPKRDTVERLQAYIREHGIDTDNWFFLTGDETKTHALANEFFSIANKNTEVAGGFEHSDFFVLVDTDRLIRGLYKGTDPQEVDRLQNDLRKLLKHEYGID